jgi:hypothetical protein
MIPKATCDPESFSESRLLNLKVVPNAAYDLENCFECRL